jgi:hypothetical protein
LVGEVVPGRYASLGLWPVRKMIRVLAIVTGGHYLYVFMRPARSQAIGDLASLRSNLTSPQVQCAIVDRDVSHRLFSLDDRDGEFVEHIKVAEAIVGAEEFALDLRERGIPAYVEHPPFHIGEFSKMEMMTGIALGCSVSVETAVNAIRFAHERFPQLKYVSLSSDLDEGYFPVWTHYIVFVGCQTEVMLSRRCQEWTDATFESLDPSMSLPVFHGIVRSLQPHPLDTQATITVLFRDGSQDGLSCNFKFQPFPEFPVKNPKSGTTEFYDLREIDGKLEYILRRPPADR